MNSKNKNRVRIAATLCALMTFCTVALQAAGPVDRNTTATYLKSPLIFEPNQGQSAPDVDFVSYAKGFVLELSRTEARMNLDQESIRMQLPGANPKAQALPVGRMDSISNYYIGNDASQWHPAIPNFTKAMYKNVYSGIDMVYYGNHEQLEYDFIVAPGADARAIALRFPEARNVRVNRDGDLLVTAQTKTMRFEKPVVYQDFDGSRHAVAARYMVSNGVASFHLGNYDRGHELVIDPNVIYSLYIGGSNFDQADAVTADAASNVYVTGVTRSVDFPTKNNSQSPSKSGAGISSAVFVQKYSSAGTLQFSTFFGSTSADQGLGIATDGTNIFVAGSTGNGATFPQVAGSTSVNRLGVGGSTDAFVAKVSPGDGALLYSVILGGSAPDQANGIALDPTGNVWIVGDTKSTNFPAAAGTISATGTQCGGYPCKDAFVAKISPATNSVLFSTVIGDVLNDFGKGVAVNATGAYVTGGTTDPTGGDYEDVFVTKFALTGGAPLYNRPYGGMNASNGNVPNDEGAAIAVDSLGNAWVTGFSQSTDFPISTSAPYNALQGLAGQQNAIIMEVDGSGNVTYATYLGGSQIDQGLGIGIDNQGNVSVAGLTTSPDFPHVNEPSATYASLNGPEDGFMARLIPTPDQHGGPFLSYSFYLGGSGSDQATALAVTPINTAQNNTFVVGFTDSLDFPAKTNTRSASSTSAGFVTLVSDAAVVVHTDGGGSGNGGGVGGSSVTFSNFDCKKLDIEQHNKKNKNDDDNFNMECTFTLGGASDGIKPVTEPMTLSIGDYSVTLPPSSFKQEGNAKDGHFKLDNKTTKGLDLHIDLKWDGGYTSNGQFLSFKLHVEGNHADLSAAQNPVAVQFSVGDDSTSTPPPTFTAKIH